MLLHHHGVLRSGTTVRGAESRQEDHAIPAHGLGHGYRWGNELPSPPQDHPQRPQVSQVSRTDLVKIYCLAAALKSDSNATDDVGTSRSLESWDYCHIKKTNRFDFSASTLYSVIWKGSTRVTNR